MKAAMKVYVVIRGEYCEYSENWGVFFTREKAEECVQYLKKPEWTWVYYPNEDEWTSGRDYIKIEEHEVQR